MTSYNLSFEITHYYGWTWHRVVLLCISRKVVNMVEYYLGPPDIGQLCHTCWWMIISQAGRFSADCNWSEIVTWTYDCFLKEGGRRAVILHCTSNWDSDPCTTTTFQIHTQLHTAYFCHWSFQPKGKIFLEQSLLKDCKCDKELFLLKKNAHKRTYMRGRKNSIEKYSCWYFSSLSIPLHVWLKDI